MMNKKNICLLVVGFLICAFTIKHVTVADTASDIENFFKGIGNDITGAYNDAIGALKRVPACANVVGKGIEWSAMQAAYYTAKGVLDLGKTLQQADPRIAQLEAEIKALEVSIAGLGATQTVGTGGLNVVSSAGRWSVQTIADVGDTVGVLFAKGINIQKAEFEINLADVKNGKLPMVGLSGIFAGKKVDFNVQINFKDIKGSLVSVGKALKGIVL